MPTAPVVVEAPTPEASFFDEDILLLTGSIFLALVVGGSFFLAVKALEALKVSVPQETVVEVGNQLVSVMQKTMAGLKTQVDSTPSPIDDVFYSVGKVGTDFLIAEIQRRSLTQEHQAALTALGEGKNS